MTKRVVGGAEGFESKKKARKQAKKGSRLENTRNERKAVIIACEDSVSAPLYFKNIFNDLKQNHAIAASSLVIAKHRHTNPCGVLQDLLDHKGYEDFDHQWIVIDRDEERTNGGGHTLEGFNQAIKQANSKKIKVAYANPCFEIWYLLHFEYRNTAIHRDELVEQLEQRWQYAKNRLFVLNEDQQKTAIRNAENLIEFCKRINNGTTQPATDNPSTTIYELVELLNGFKGQLNHHQLAVSCAMR